jgi:hypothetical protein
MKQFIYWGFITCFTLLYNNSNAQTVKYYYDVTGNRTEKIIDLGEDLKSSQNSKALKKSLLESLKAIEIKDDTFKQDILIYPNPTKGLIRLEIPENPENNGILQITVQDINGKVIYTKPHEALVTEVDLSDQPEGIYILVLKKGTITSQWKIIKHK